jgi:hypothetical protein
MEQNRRVKTITKYEDNTGKAWNTEKEALISDAKLLIKQSIEKHLWVGITHNKDGTIKTPVTRVIYEDLWLDELRKDKNMSVIKALLYVLDIDDTKLAVERIRNS